MLLKVIEAEGAGYIDQHSQLRDADGHRRVVHNWHRPARGIRTGLGPVPISQPRINDKRPRQKFTSNILPPFMCQNYRLAGISLFKLLRPRRQRTDFNGNRSDLLLSRSSALYIFLTVCGACSCGVDCLDCLADRVM